MTCWKVEIEVESRRSSYCSPLALLINKDRRHLSVTPWSYPSEPSQHSPSLEHPCPPLALYTLFYSILLAVIKTVKVDYITYIIMLLLRKKQSFNLSLFLSFFPFKEHVESD